MTASCATADEDSLFHEHAGLYGATHVTPQIDVTVISRLCRNTKQRACHVPNLILPNDCPSKGKRRRPPHIESMEPIMSKSFSEALSFFPSHCTHSIVLSCALEPEN